MYPSLLHRAACIAVALIAVLPGPPARASGDVVPRAAPAGSGPQTAPVEFDFELFETRPLHHQNEPMTRARWVRAAMRLNQGLTRAEARRAWRNPALRRSLPITTHNFQRGVRWTNPAIAGAAQQASGGCHVTTTKWTYGYFVKATWPFFTRDPLFRFTLHRTWDYNGWRVFPKNEWHDWNITPFADLRWNFEGVIDQQSAYIPVGGSSMATHLHTRTGRFKSFSTLLGAPTDDVKRHILAKWHGGWETPGRSAHFCTDND